MLVDAVANYARRLKIDTLWVQTDIHFWGMFGRLGFEGVAAIRSVENRPATALERRRSNIIEDIHSIDAVDVKVAYSSDVLLMRKILMPPRKPALWREKSSYNNIPRHMRLMEVRGAQDEARGSSNQNSVMRRFLRLKPFDRFRRHKRSLQTLQRKASTGSELGV